MRNFFPQVNLQKETRVRSKTFFAAISLLSVGVLGYLDYIISPEVAILYLIPITLAAWHVGAAAGVAVSLISSAIWLYDDLLTRYTDPGSLTPYWEAAVRLGFFLTVSFMVSRLYVSLRNEKKLSRTDTVTGIANGRHFTELAGIELEKLKRYGHPLTVVYMDVDNFKTVNDTYGHNAGDDLLCLIADTIQENIRTSDFPARIGGDEFAVLFTETNDGKARTAVAKLQGQLMSAMEHKGYPVTFSFGSVTFGAAPSSVNEVMTLTDNVMYKAKRTGKNRIVYEQYAGRKKTARQVL